MPNDVSRLLMHSSKIQMFLQHDLYLTVQTKISWNGEAKTVVRDCWSWHKLMFSRMVLTFYSSQFLSIHCSIFAHKTRALVDTFVFFFIVAFYIQQGLAILRWGEALESVLKVKWYYPCMQVVIIHRGKGRA